MSGGDGGDPPLQAPLKMRPPPALVTLTALGLAAATFYPLWVERALDAWGVRPLAAALLGLGALSLLCWRRFGPEGGTPLGLHSLLLLLPAAALLGGGERALRLLPVAIQLLIAVSFALSLRGGRSILEDTAKRIHPYAPDFIGPYCRKVTLVFSAIFAAQAAGVAWIVLDPPDSGAAVASGVLAWAPVMLASAMEWAVRKSWFRYYTDGPIDRRLRRWLPPENTAVGRRSLEYIRSMRRELGMPPP